MADSLLIGLSALQTHNRAMQVTSHNIANAGTPGYSRQTVDMSSPIPEKTAVGSIGRGVEITAVRRTADTLLTERLRQTFSESGRLETMGKTLGDLEMVYNEPSDGGLSAVINQVFASFEDLSNNAESNALRGGAVQQLETFATTIRNLHSRIEQMRNNQALDARVEVNEINVLSQQLATLNGEIQRETLVGRIPNDLLDERDRLVNDISQHLNVRAIEDVSDMTVRIEVSGTVLVGKGEYQEVGTKIVGEGNVVLTLAENGEVINPGGGSFGAIVELSGTTIPNVLSDLDEMAQSVIREFNAVNATSLSHSYNEPLHNSARTIPVSLLHTNLDAVAMAEAVVGDVGISADFQPSFVDASGATVPQNMTMNVFNNDTGVAEKYTLRYEAGTGITEAGRSLADLVSAINTGRGGGWTLYPSQNGGVGNVTAKAVAVSDGVKLQLATDSSHSIDFSTSLDTRPTDAAWSAPDVSVTGTDAALVDNRLVFEVQNGGTELLVFGHDPVSGQRVPYPGPGFSTIDLTAAGPAVVGGLTLSYTTGAANYQDGESFGVDFDATGTAAFTQSSQWTNGNAGFTVKGRYTGSHGFDPSRPWSVNVLTGGTIGASDLNSPPVIEVSWYSGPEGGPIKQSRQVVLNEDLRAGDPVEIADGVYIVFDEGDLSIGEQIDYTVDGQPDQAGVLSALGINTMFSGSGASDISVVQNLLDNPTRLGVAKTRAPGDNSSVLDLIAVRRAESFGSENTTLDDFYQSQVSDVASLVRQNDTLSQGQDLVQASLQNQREEMSGVSIDEEVGLLILQQNAYAAAARIVSVARENIDTLMGILA